MSPPGWFERLDKYSFVIQALLRRRRMTRLTLIITLFLSAVSVQAFGKQLMDVVVVDRQDNASTYTYSVPGYSSSSSTLTANCTAFDSFGNCIGQANTTTFSSPGYTGSYQVRGATLTLKLPDNRMVVVNCASKVNWTEWSNPNTHRSCRIPLVNRIQAEFNKDNAKLRWPVSIDGKKLQHETYKIIAILDGQ